uniref:NADH dehydrogenase subunit 3 n=1 Tax=Lynceus grossipedia TaxID=2774322 RepID=UPI0023AA4CDF|nr:NADH dehydrogenase subunit 3 [Lynceus grossipedia]WCD23724.1 NADH dehydrogenase subunit 3 [Lynceus grossipedia]
MKTLLFTPTLLVSTVVAFIMILLNFFLSFKTYMDREKSSPFECGFDPNTSSRLPFSLRFFLMALLFLIFDVETVVILPFIILSDISSVSNILTTFIFFLIILNIGLIIEWKQGALDWAN